MYLSTLATLSFFRPCNKQKQKTIPPTTTQEPLHVPIQIEVPERPVSVHGKAAPIPFVLPELLQDAGALEDVRQGYLVPVARHDVALCIEEEA